jgi:hypothetical protein
MKRIKFVGLDAARPQLSFTAYLARLQRAMVPGLILGVDGAKPPPADSAVVQTDNRQLTTKMLARRHFALGIKTVAAHNITI